MDAKAPASPVPKVPAEADQDELRRLRKENARLRKERDDALGSYLELYHPFFLALWGNRLVFIY
jgi:hypothetical protein